MTFEMTRIKQRFADLENNQSHYLKLQLVFYNKLKMQMQLELEEIVNKNTGKDHP